MEGEPPSRGEELLWSLRPSSFRNYLQAAPKRHRGLGLDGNGVNVVSVVELRIARSQILRSRSSGMEMDLPGIALVDDKKESIRPLAFVGMHHSLCVLPLRGTTAVMEPFRVNIVLRLTHNTTMTTATRIHVSYGCASGQMGFMS